MIIRTALRSTNFEEAESDLLKTAQDIQAKIQKDTLLFGVKVENLTIHELDLRGG